MSDCDGGSVKWLLIRRITYLGLATQERNLNFPLCGSDILPYGTLSRIVVQNIVPTIHVTNRIYSVRRKKTGEPETQLKAKA